MKTREEIRASLHSGHSGRMGPCTCPIPDGAVTCGKPHYAIAVLEAHIERIDAVQPEDEEHAAFLRFHRAHAATKLEHIRNPPKPREPIGYEVHVKGEVKHRTSGPHLARELAEKHGGHVRPVFEEPT